MKESLNFPTLLDPGPDPGDVREVNENFGLSKEDEAMDWIRNDGEAQLTDGAICRNRAFGSGGSQSQ
jgi:hypothetical protein